VSVIGRTEAKVWLVTSHGIPLLRSIPAAISAAWIVGKLPMAVVCESRWLFIVCFFGFCKYNKQKPDKSQYGWKNIGRFRQNAVMQALRIFNMTIGLKKRLGSLLIGWKIVTLWRYNALSSVSDIPN
jgi:hypothetical protein